MRFTRLKAAAVALISFPALMLAACGDDTTATSDEVTYASWSEYTADMREQWDNNCGYRDAECYARNIALVENIQEDTAHLGEGNEFAEMLPDQVDAFIGLHESAVDLGCYQRASACTEFLELMQETNGNIHELFFYAN